MKFKVIIDDQAEEQVVATVHHHSKLIDEIEALIAKHDPSERLVAYTDDNIKLLPITNIECITVIDGKTYAIDENNQQYRLKQRLYELETILPSCFIRINKSTLANERRLDRFTVAYSGAVDAVFKCGYKEYVSRRCFSQIKRRLESK